MKFSEIKNYSKSTLDEQRRSVGYHVWKSVIENPFVVRATKGRVKNEFIGSYKTEEEARKAAKEYPDAKIYNNISGKEIEYEKTGSLGETTSAGAVAAVAQPMGNMISRKPRKRSKTAEQAHQDHAGIKVGDKVRTLRQGQIPGTVTGFTNKRGYTQVVFQHESGKTYATSPDNLEVLESVSESKPKGLYYNVNKRKKAGTSRPKGHPKAPTDQAWKDAAKTAKESTELDEGAREWVLGALVGMGLIGSVAGLSHLDRQAFANDAQLQTLITYYQEAEAEGDRAAMRDLKQRIKRQKDRISLGKGPVRDASGTPIVPQRDRTTDARRPGSLEETLHGDEFFEKYGWVEWPEQLVEAEYQGRTVQLHQPVRSIGGPKQYYVYLENAQGEVGKVNFGDAHTQLRVAGLPLKENRREVESAIIQRLGKLHLDLLTRYGIDAVSLAVEDVVSRISDDLEEIGSSDVSGWVMRVKDILDSGAYDHVNEAEYQGRKVTLNKPMPNCDNPGPKTKARYWSCRAW